MDPGYDVPPDDPALLERSGLAHHVLADGSSGPRFVLNVPDDRGHRLRSWASRAVAEPVRVFVGYDMAKTAEDRVALALDELERTGAYDRSLLIVGSPRAPACVNTVRVRDRRLPAARRLRRRGRAVRALAVVAVPASHRRRRPPPPTAARGHPRRVGAPTVEQRATAGASSTARASARGPVRTRSCTKGSTGLDELGVERALWVGTPYYSGWLHEAMASDSGARRSSCVEVPSVLPSARPVEARTRPAAGRAAEPPQRPDPQAQPRPARAPPGVARDPTPADRAAASALHTR